VVYCCEVQIFVILCVSLPEEIFAIQIFAKAFRFLWEFPYFVSRAQEKPKIYYFYQIKLFNKNIKIFSNWQEFLHIQMVFTNFTKFGPRNSILFVINRYSKAALCLEELILSNPHRHLYHQCLAEVIIINTLKSLK